jgi:hypothetical protein
MSAFSDQNLGLGLVFVEFVLRLLELRLCGLRFRVHDVERK